MYIYIYIYHHVVLLARISLTLSRRFSLLFIASGRSSGLHPVSSQSCCMYVRAGRPAFARPYVGVHRSTSLMSSSLLLQQCPTCLVRLTSIVFGWWWWYWAIFLFESPDIFHINMFKDISLGLIFSKYPWTLLFTSLSSLSNAPKLLLHLRSLMNILYIR